MKTKQARNHSDLGDDMQVVVLMGGLGTRLGGAGLSSPKAMVDVYKRPFFCYQLQLMKWSGLRKFIFCVGYKQENIHSFFKDGRRFGVNIQYSFDGKELIGTAGALKKAGHLLKNDFMVIYGDSYMDVDYLELIGAYLRSREKGKSALLAVFRNKNKYDKSNVIFKNNRLLKYDKKNISADMECIDYGISILNKRLLRRIPRNKYFDISDFYSSLVSGELMSGYEVKNRFYEIGTPDSLGEFKKFIYQRSLVKKPGIILDRDGTLNEICLNEDTEMLDSPLSVREFKLLPKVISGLRILKSLGYAVMVVSNQPAAAKGKAALSDIYAVNNRLKDILRKRGVVLDDFLICPHYPSGSPHTTERFLIRDCECRKPKPGLLRRAISKFNLDVESSYMAGDSYVDILAGREAKMKTVFLGEYKCDCCQLLKRKIPDYTFKNLYDFAVFLRERRG